MIYHRHLTWKKYENDYCKKNSGIFINLHFLTLFEGRLKIFIKNITMKIIMQA